MANMNLPTLTCSASSDRYFWGWRRAIASFLRQGRSLPINYR
ncbi:hypothetical protein [Phormidium nigroviride]